MTPVDRLAEKRNKWKSDKQKTGTQHQDFGSDLQAQLEQLNEATTNILSKDSKFNKSIPKQSEYDQEEPPLDHKNIPSHVQHHFIQNEDNLINFNEWQDKISKQPQDEEMPEPDQNSVKKHPGSLKIKKKDIILKNQISK